MADTERAQALLADVSALRGILDAVPHPIFIKDEDSCFLVVNRLMCEIMSRSFEELVGKSDYAFVPVEQADAFRANDLRVLASGEPNEAEEDFTDGNGELRTVVTRKKRLELADGTRVIVACLTDITAYRRAETLIRHNAEHDPLTGLANRSLFVDTLRAAIARAAKGGPAPALLLIDLDGFKNVNDTLGHIAGDDLLIQTARILIEVAGADDVVARLGGDEFAIIHATTDSQQTAEMLATAVVEELSRPMFAAGRQAEMSASIGIAVVPPGIGSENMLLRHADLALYAAKKHGRNAWRVFDPAMEAHQIAGRFLERHLRASLEAGRFILRYQPILRAGDLQVVGFEALLRWNHPTRGEIGPADFIDVAEATGIIVPLGEWVVREACAVAAGWPNPLRISINISPVQFSRSDVVGLVRSAVQETGIDPSRIELELTETAVIKDLKGANRIFALLRGLGVNVVLDDFGAGYSSLQILKSLPFNKIKIDRSLLQDVGRTTQADAIIGAILRLTRTLDLATVAEGVETAEQLAVLQREGCTEVQGYLFGRPGAVGDAAGEAEPRPVAIVA